MAEIRRNTPGINEYLNLLQSTREYRDQMWGSSDYEKLLENNHLGHETKKEKNMTTKFSIDLDKNELSFGTIANGQIVNIEGGLTVSSKAGTPPYGGILEGDFIGSIKQSKSIPITIPHKRIPVSGFNIMIVGAGGTGGYLIRDLSRFIYALKQKGDSSSFDISIIDGDIVEKKNILRQNFMPGDIGKKKADVLAARHSKAFGLEIQSVTEMADYNLLNKLHMRASGYNVLPIQNIVIGCVDNHSARREMKKYLENNRDAYWIDSGNETKSGQAVLGHKSFRRQFPTNRDPTRNTNYALPNVIDLYPEISDPSQDEVEEVKSSCAERAMIDTQNIFVNMTAAGHVLSFIRQIVMNESITSNVIEFNIKGVTNVKHLTSEYLKESFTKARLL